MSEHSDKIVKVKVANGKIENWRISNLSKSEEDIIREVSSEVSSEVSAWKEGNNSEKGTGLDDSVSRSTLKEKRIISDQNRRPAIAPECYTDMDNMSANSVKPQVGDVKARQEDVYELTKKQVEAFREVFDLFDLNGGGTIDAEELEKALNSVDIMLTQAEIIDVLTVIDDDGNGEIDFDEFLNLMTSTEKFLEDRDHSHDSSSQSLLFTALTKFMRKTALSSLTEIEWYYHKKERKYPHVVAHYAAGARLIGLTEKQLAIHLANLRFKYKAGDSPYCQPIWRLPEEKTKPGRRKMKGKIKLKVKFHNSKSEEKSKEKKDNRVNKRVTQSQHFTRTRRDIPIKLDVKPLARLAYVSLAEIERCRINLSPTLNFEDVPLIRRKISEAQDDYHMRIKIRRNKLYTQNPHLFDLDVRNIPSNILKFNFTQALESYGISKGPEVNSNKKMKKISGPWQTLMRVKYGDIYRSS